MKWPDLGDWLDYEVLFTIVFAFVFAVGFLSFPGSAAMIVFVMQFMIWTRGLVDRKAHGKPYKAYILMNESVVGAAVALNWLIYLLGFNGLMGILIAKRAADL